MKEQGRKDLGGDAIADFIQKHPHMYIPGMQLLTRIRVLESGRLSSDSQHEAIVLGVRKLLPIIGFVLPQWID